MPLEVQNKQLRHCNYNCKRRLTILNNFFGNWDLAYPI